MATTLYVNPDPATAATGNAIGCGWVRAVPASFAGIATAPCVILSGAGQTVVIADDGALTPSRVSSALAPILAAEAAAAAVVAASAANQSTIQANIATHITQIEAWLTANPNGAVLTAAQTKFLAQALVGVGRVLLGLTDKVGGAT